MKNIINTIIATLTLVVASTVTNAASLKVEFTNIAEHKGELMVVLYDSAQAYSNNGQPTRFVSIPVSSEQAAYSFENLPEGNYAIKLFHDTNGNRKLDMNMLGIPQEGYGFSNNVGRFGEPEFEEAVFNIVKDTSISIIVR